MKEYVCGFMRDEAGDLVLVRKNKPAWQAGRLNGIGGGIEPNEETPLFAMRREWKEETGHDHHDWKPLASIHFNDSVVHFFKASVDAFPYFPAHNDIGEAIEIHPYLNVIRYDDMIQNLKWLLPLAFEDPDGLAVTSHYAANDNGPISLKEAA